MTRLSILTCRTPSGPITKKPYNLNDILIPVNSYPDAGIYSTLTQPRDIERHDNGREHVDDVTSERTTLTAQRRSRDHYGCPLVFGRNITQTIRDIEMNTDVIITYLIALQRDTLFKD